MYNKRNRGSGDSCAVAPPQYIPAQSIEVQKYARNAFFTGPLRRKRGYFMRLAARKKNDCNRQQKKTRRRGRSQPVLGTDHFRLEHFSSFGSLRQTGRMHPGNQNKANDHQQEPGTVFAEMDRLPAIALMGIDPYGGKSPYIFGTPDEERDQAEPQ